MCSTEAARNLIGLMEQQIELFCTDTRHGDVSDSTVHPGENNHSDHYVNLIPAVCFINEITLHLHTLSLIGHLIVSLFKELLWSSISITKQTWLHF